MGHGTSQETFNCRMEILIKQKKELTLSIKSGFYSEELMKTELKFKPPIALTLKPHLYMWNCSIEYMPGVC